MVIFKIIFSILFSPLRLLLNLFQPKNTILEWHFNYGYSFVTIKTIHKEKILSDDILVASYVLFLARYFFICDDRQTGVIRDALLDNIKKSHNPGELASILLGAIFHTLNQGEQEAANGLFNSSPFIPVPEFPLTYSESEEPKHSLAKYSFLVFKHGGNPVANFYLSAGPNIILLPLTVGILYEYVVDKIRDKDKKRILDKSITDLLEAHNSVDCRLIDGLRKLPVEIINKNNLNYEK